MTAIGLRDDGTMSDSLRLVLRAADFAARAHQRQRRKDEEATPYINHLIEVAHLLAEANCPPAVIAAGFLHDVVEDTHIPITAIEAEFGEEIASLVLAVTDNKLLPKAERKRLQVERAATANPGTAALKMADKISNLRSLAAAPPANWEEERKREYLEWASRVVGQLREIPEELRLRYTEIRMELRSLEVPSGDSH